jgi:hypothetical protein
MRRINTTVLAGLILAAVPASDSAAQPHTGRIAFDFCYSVGAPEGGYIMQCDVWVVEADGSRYGLGSGLMRVLSPDGTLVITTSTSRRTGRASRSRESEALQRSWARRHP